MNKSFSVAVCFVLVLMMVLTSCADDKISFANNTEEITETNISTETVQAEAESGETEDESGKTDEAAVADFIEDIEAWRIIRADMAGDTVKQSLTKLHTAISEEIGDRLSVGTDWSEAAGAEIIIGNSNRAASDEAAKYLKTDFDYIIKTFDQSIVIMGLTDASTAKAVDFFIENYIGDGKVYFPAEEGIIYNVDFKLDTFTVGGVDISEFKFYYIDAGNTLGGQNTYDEVADLSYRLESEYIGKKLELTSSLIDKENLIIYDRSGLDYEKGGIKVENGDLYIYGSYHSIENTVNYFFETVLGDNSSVSLPADFSVEISTDDLPDIYSKDDLMAVLQYVYDTRDLLIVGDEVNNSRRVPSTMLEPYYESTGAYPSIMGLDLGRCGYKMPTLPDDQWMIISQMLCESIDYAARGGVITIGNHMTNPNPENIPKGSTEERGDLGDEQAWIDLITEGTESNARFKSELELNAIVLQAFEDAGVPIIWRPFHECNGGWFWWTPELGSTRYDSKYFVDMWIYVYEFFTEEKGLTNLIWEYSPSTSTHMDTMYLYPGDDYCDIVGVDWYTGGKFEIIAEHKPYEQLMATGKITNLAEIGPSSSLFGKTKEEQAEIYTAMELIGNAYSMYYEDYKIAYFMTYAGKTSLMWLPGGDEVMKDKRVLELSEMLPLFEKVTGFKPGM